jgi:GTP1/Obg family GTP-binding protein
MNHLELAQTQLTLLDERKKSLEKVKAGAEASLRSIEDEYFDTVTRTQSIQEIYRVARIQFGRLRHAPDALLTSKDVQELDKWIGRAKSTTGLMDILKALRALEKYRPIDIKKNLYALVQRIIMEGPYPKKPK